MRDAIERARLERRIALVFLLVMGLVCAVITWLRDGGL